MHVVHISVMANAYNEANFEAEVINSDKPVLVDFWAEWCGPCKMISPLIDQLAEAVGDTANVGKVEVDTNQSLAAKYGVRSIPCLLFFKDGEVKDTITGANVTLDQLKSKLEELALDLAYQPSSGACFINSPLFSIKLPRAFLQGPRHIFGCLVAGPLCSGCFPQEIPPSSRQTRFHIWIKCYISSIFLLGEHYWQHLGACNGSVYREGGFFYWLSSSAH